MSIRGKKIEKGNETKQKKQLKLEHTMRGRYMLVAIVDARELFYFGFVRIECICCAVDFHLNYRNRCSSFVTNGILHTKTLRNQINIFIFKVILLNYEFVCEVKLFVSSTIINVETTLNIQSFQSKSNCSHMKYM